MTQRYGWVAALAVCSVSCAGALVGGGPGQEPPVAPLRAVAVVVTDGHRPIVGAVCGLDGEMGHSEPSNADGYVLFRTVPTTLRATHLVCVADGYRAFSNHRDLLTGANEDLSPITMVSLRVNLPRLVRRGRVFGLENGQRFTVISASDFNLLARFLAGENIEPILTQRAETAGFNTLRVWTRYDLTVPPPIGRLLMADADYGRVGDFLQALARHGLYAELTAYAGQNTYDRVHWLKLCQAVQGATNVTLELVNELDQNDPASFPLEAFAPCPGILSSHGSGGSEQLPVLPHWDYAAFHTNGANEWWRKTGHNAMEQGDLPVVANENTRFPDNDDNPAHAFDAAAGAALLAAGSTFHSTAGKPSVLWNDPQLALAQAWVEGAKSVPLDCQDGLYRHLGDREGPGDLRIYQRGDDQRCVVRIRR